MPGAGAGRRGPGRNLCPGIQHRQPEYPQRPGHRVCLAGQRAPGRPGARDRRKRRLVPDRHAGRRSNRLYEQEFPDDHQQRGKLYRQRYLYPLFRRNLWRCERHRIAERPHRPRPPVYRAGPPGPGRKSVHFRRTQRLVSGYVNQRRPDRLCEQELYYPRSRRSLPGQLLRKHHSPCE